MNANIEHVLQDYQSQTLAESAVLRQLVEYDKWQVPVTLTALHTNTSESEIPPNWLVLFTGASSISTFERATQQRLDFNYHMSGIHAFGTLIETCGGIVINPYCENATRFPSHRLHALKEAADGIALEAILNGEIDFPDTFDRFRRFKGFRVPTRIVNGTRQLMLAPDDQGRKLAPVFTTVDAANAYLEHANTVLEFEPDIRVFEGHVLFESMMGMPVDGIVFNCNGPAPPKAVSIQFAQVVLQN